MLEPLVLWPGAYRDLDPALGDVGEAGLPHGVGRPVAPEEALARRRADLLEDVDPRLERRVGPQGVVVGARDAPELDVFDKAAGLDVSGWKRSGC